MPRTQSFERVPSKPLVDVLPPRPSTAADESLMTHRSLVHTVQWPVRGEGIRFAVVRPGSFDGWSAGGFRDHLKRVFLAPFTENVDPCPAEEC
jgi:hypothetical protein